jgi:hypothetical protein
VLCVSHWFRVPLSQLFSMILMFLWIVLDTSTYVWLLSYRSLFF